MVDVAPRQDRGDAIMRGTRGFDVLVMETPRGEGRCESALTTTNLAEGSTYVKT